MPIGLSKKNRADLIDELVYLSGRELSIIQMTYLQAIADRNGLNLTDMRCLVFIVRSEKTISAGDLVKITGLTTGAITGVIDRLEAAGFIKRDRDDSDRRLVIIKPVNERRNEVRKLFDSINKRRQKMLNSLNDQELIIIKNFMDKNIEMITEEINSLRQETP
jgi:DNA-binding MarR family transcriptional regulator